MPYVDHVRFTSQSGHRDFASECLLRAKSGHMQRSKIESQSVHRSEGCHIKAAQKGVPVMTREQKIVVIGSASGVVTMIAAVVGIYQIWPNNPSRADAASRLAYTVQANAFAVIPLLLGILVVANARFLSEAIDPTLQKEDLAMQINGRVVNNTLQQFILFFVATTALCVNVSSTQMRLIPAATIVF